MSAPAVLQAQGLCFGYPKLSLFDGWSAALAPGVTLVCGDDGAGKSTLLRLLAGVVPPQAGNLWVNGVALADAPQAYRAQVFWVDARNDASDTLTPGDCFDALARRYPAFQRALLADLLDGLSLGPHLAKQMHMLSTGTRRKVWLAGAFAAGAAVTLLDEPFAALDRPSITFVTTLLQEAAGHATRAWVVADYEAPPGVPLAGTIRLGD